MKYKLSFNFLILLVIFLLFISLRIINLSADPPNNLSVSSCGEYGDPGNYAFNARNKVLFGRWKIDEFNIMYISPIPHVFTYFSFVLFGTGICQMNLVPVFFSILIFILSYYLADKYFPNAKFIFLFFLAINYPFIMYSRIATRIMPMTFFALLAVFFYLEGFKKPQYFFLSGFSLWMSFMSKGKIIYFIVLVIPISFILTIIIKDELHLFKLNIKRITYLVLGVISLLIPWYYLLYSPHHTLFKDFSFLNLNIMKPKSMHEMIENWFLHPPFSFYPTNIILSVLLFVYFLTFLFRYFQKEEKRHGSDILPLEILCVCWLIIGLLINSVLNYRPIRHYIEFSIPIFILASLVLSQLQRKLSIRFTRNVLWLYFLSVFLLIWISSTSFIRFIFVTENIKNNLWNVVIIISLISFILFIFFTLIIYLLKRKEIILNKNICLGLLFLLLSLYGVHNLKEYADWTRHQTFNLKIISRDLGKAFPDSVFCGLLVPSISMENKNVAHTSWQNFVNDNKNFLKEMGVKYLFLGTFNREHDYYKKNFPDEMRRAKFIAKYWIWRSWFLLYELTEASFEEPQGLFEAEKMDREIGIPLFDPQASNRFSVFVDKSKKGIVCKVPISIEKKQIMSILLYLKDRNINSMAPILGLRITKERQVILKRSFKMNKGENSNFYKSIGTKVFFPEKGDYFLEIMTLGNEPFYLDKVELR